MKDCGLGKNRWPAVVKSRQLPESRVRQVPGVNSISEKSWTRWQLRRSLPLAATVVWGDTSRPRERVTCNLGQRTKQRRDLRVRTSHRRRIQRSFLQLPWWLQGNCSLGDFLTPSTLQTAKKEGTVFLRRNVLKSYELHEDADLPTNQFYKAESFLRSWQFFTWIRNSSLLRNQMIYYRVQKRLSLVRSQINPTHTFLTYALRKIEFF